TLAILIAGIIFPWMVFAQGVGTPGGTIQFATTNAVLGGGFAPLAHVQTLPFGTVTDPASIWAAIGQAPFPGPSGDFPYGLRLQKNLSLGVFNLVNEGGAENLVIGFGENQENAIRFRYISDQLTNTFDDPLVVTGNGRGGAGRVGIGTTNPSQARLDIVADAPTRSGNQGIGLHIRHDGGSFINYGALIENEGGIASYGLSSNSRNARVGFGLIGESVNAEAVGYGVYGRSLNVSTGSAWGVFGIVANSTTQYGIFGGAASGPTSYAGYFNGDLVYTGSFGSVSDRRLKKDIKTLNSALDIVSQLRPTTYTFRTDEFAYMNLDQDLQYGFIAQEIEEVLPSLTMNIRQPIMEDNDPEKVSHEDFTGVDYVQLIPILTAAIQELQQEVVALKSQLAESKEYKGNATGFTIPGEKATLFQNEPNPFASSTTIRYQIPGTFERAELYIFDMQGKKVKTFEGLNARGQVEILGSTLDAGTYIYTLVVDGQEMDTKRMILTK
ncbi:MAG: tail fiber domain-containing protein, partial [Bacteroidota bacterium]